MSDRQFAFGDFTHNGNNCPVKEAGLMGEAMDAELGEEFDDWARHAFGPTKGAVSEERAKEVWLEMSKMLKSRAESDADCLSGQMYDLAERVREELDW